MSIKTMIDNYQNFLSVICDKVKNGEKNVESGLLEIERLHSNFYDMLLSIESFGGFNGNRVWCYISSIDLKYFYSKKSIEKCKNKLYNVVLHTETGDRVIKKNLSLYDAKYYFDGIENTYIVERGVK